MMRDWHPVGNISKIRGVSSWCDANRTDGSRKVGAPRGKKKKKRPRRTRIVKKITK